MRNGFHFSDAVLSRTEGLQPGGVDLPRPAQGYADTLGIAPLKDTSELYYSIMKEWNEQSENGEINDDFLVGRQNQLQYLLHLFSRMHRSKHARVFRNSWRSGSRQNPSFVILSFAW